MKIPYNWLREYIDLEGLTIEEIAKKLTLAGSEVSSIETTGGDIPGVVVGKVLSVHKHPDAERLAVSKVDIGDCVLSIVSGAPNVEADIYVAVATIGAKLPNGMTIRRTSIRGFESNGMICSKSELGYEGDISEGIWVIEKDDIKLGDSISSIVGSVEYVFNVEVTANRGDILSIVGFARECSLVLEKRISFPTPQTFEAIGGNIDILVEASELCPKYIARLIKDVTVTQSPDWVQNRLKMCGIKPINNIVDATNYVMLEYGQPIHAFDFDKIEDEKIIVRTARDGEKIVLLDGREIALAEDILVIADSKKPIAIAGVMGGEYSSIGSTTKNIIIESAYFDAIAIRRASAVTNTKTDASYRYERGIDPTLTLSALNRVVELIINFSKNAKISSRAKEVNSKHFENRHIIFDCDLVKKYLSLPLNRMEIVAMLKRYGFSATALGGNSLKVSIPHHRNDLTMSVDLVEEIARVHGYDNLETTIPHIRTNEVKTDYKELSKIKHAMASYGLWEIKGYSIGSSELYKKLGYKEEDLIAIIKPLSKDFDVLRPTAFTSLMNTVSYNQSHRHKNGALFEMGNIFYKDVSGNYIEEKRLTAALFGLSKTKSWNEEERKYDFFDLSGILEKLLTHNLHTKNYKLTPSTNISNMTPTQCAYVSIFDKVVGFIGQVHPKVLEHFDITGEVYYFDINIREVLNLVKEYSDRKIYKDIGKYPAVYRDLALICDKSVEFNCVLNDIRNLNEIIQDVKVVDRYVGAQVPDGKSSIAISIIYFDSSRTLRDEEINLVEKQILDMVAGKYNIILRSV